MNGKEYFKGIINTKSSLYLCWKGSTFMTEFGRDLAVNFGAWNNAI